MKYNSRVLFCCLSVVLTCFLSSATHSQEIGDRNKASTTDGGSGSHVIDGKVLFPDGRPAVGVTVTINGFGFGRNKTVTDKNGGFSFRDVPKGSYSIDAKADGYDTASDSITIDKYASRNQGYVIALHLRARGQTKSEKSSSNLILKGIPKEPLGKYEQAMEKLETNDSKAALKLLDEAIALHPNFAAAYYQKGAASLKMNEVDKAIEAFVKAISIKSDYVEAKYGYGMAMFMKKNYEVAEAVFRDVLKEKSDMAEARMNLGISLFYLQDIDAAITELKAAAGEKGGDKLGLTHLYLGQIYIQKKRNADAIIELEKYLKMLPKAPNADRVRSTIADLKKQT